MGFGAFVRARRVSEGISLNDFVARLGLSASYWSRIEREHEKPPRDMFIQRAAAILGIRLDDIFIEAGRLPPDIRDNLRRAVEIYRRERHLDPTSKDRRGRPPKVGLNDAVDTCRSLQTTADQLQANTADVPVHRFATAGGTQALSSQE